MADDSHTNFKRQAFTLGAVGGSATIAAALMNGARNVAALRRSRVVHHAVQTRDALIASMQQHIEKQRSELLRRDAIIQEQAMAVRELNLRLKMTQWLRQRGQ